MEGKKISKKDCPHVQEIKITTSDKKQCGECDIKEHLRLCTTCGSVNCCESGQGHNTEHYEDTGHPIITPVHTKYHFTWCYKCQAYLT